jgi:NADH-quinone oxidoreductase subunit F
MQKYLLRNADNPNPSSIDEYEKTGGYSGLKKALTMGSKTIIDEIKEANLRGRGGAGFPTHMKWSFAVPVDNFPKYIVCNADEAEPGTFKDRDIMEKNPHLLIEGMIIASLAIASEHGFVYLRGEYPVARKTLQESIDQAYAKGYLGESVMGSGKRFDLQIHRGAGAYICGESTAMLDSMEGKRGFPRVKPPFSVVSGYLKKPTVTNNVETFANVPIILEIGAAEYKKIGIPESPGPKLFSVSGHVESPGVYELAMGITLKELIFDHCGGIKGGSRLKGIIPGGVSVPVIKPDKLDCPLDFVSPRKYGTMLGSGGVIVMDETTCMVRASLRITLFFEHESCGKCTPCREGCGWLRSILDRIEHGEGKREDLDLLVEIAGNMEGNCFCALGDSAAVSMKSFLDNYREEFEAHIEQQRCVVLPPEGTA